MFTTKRLMLRALDPEKDENLLLQAMNNKELLDLVSLGPRIPGTRAGLKKLLSQHSSSTYGLPWFAICLKPESPETSWPHNLGPNDDYYEKAPPMIGTLGLMDRGFDYKNRIAYVGLNFPDPAHRGKGYGQEVLHWALGYAFEELGLHKLSLDVYENNPHARKCYERVGFVTEGRLRKAYWSCGRWWDKFEMGVLEEEWFENKGQEGEKVTLDTVTRG